MSPTHRSVTLGKTWSPGEPQHYDRGQWAGFAVVLSVNLIGEDRLVRLLSADADDPRTGLLVVALRRDIVWCVAATWICASLWSQKPKPYPVFVSTAVVMHIVDGGAHQCPTYTSSRRSRSRPSTPSP